MTTKEIFTLQYKNLYALPILHYNMEMAAQVKLAFDHLKPDCVAVEFAETMHLQLLHAASRLPDISVVSAENTNGKALYYLCEPCDAGFEALRSALEHQIPAYCIDLDIEDYPNFKDRLPDPYAIRQIGLKQYYSLFCAHAKKLQKPAQDVQREIYMARRLKELSLQYEKVLFIGGMLHVNSILEHIDQNVFPKQSAIVRQNIQVHALTEESSREVMIEYGWISQAYEEARQNNKDFPPDRHQLIYQLYKTSGHQLQKKNSESLPGYSLRQLMKFSRNYALVKSQLMPNLFQILSSARACAGHNYAYETWLLATHYPFRKNIDNLPEIKLTIEEIWGHSKHLRFHLKQPSRKSKFMQVRKKDRPHAQFNPPSAFSICSYPPEDVVVERFGDFLKKKGTLILSEDAARTMPFSTGLEDGIDIKETIRHFFEHKLYVKINGRPPGAAGSVVIVFDEDLTEEHEKQEIEKYPWKVTWLGEHSQESDMAFYATDMKQNVVGPGISRCEYGGFMMSSPPRRMFDIWNDEDYTECRSKAEVLLMAAIDYAIKPIIVYVAKKPPRTKMKSFAARYGKKIVYIPIGQLSPVTLNKLRIFHVLDGYDKREIAGDYIF